MFSAEAPALTGVTVRVAFGPNNDVTAEVAGAVILEPSLEKVDELLHVGRRIRAIARQSAIGGMGSSLGKMRAALGFPPPVGGALMQEVIDVRALLNVFRRVLPPQSLSDF